MHAPRWQGFVCLRWPLGAIATLAVTAIGIGTSSTSSWASDHEDAPSLTSDPGVDIADVHAFPSPSDPNRLVLSMTVHPKATAATAFETNVEYKFRIAGYDPVGNAIDPTLDETIACRFQTAATGPQIVLCSANGFSAESTVGAKDGGANGDLRIFAGLRADPAFGDVDALGATLVHHQLMLVDAGGTNAFAGQNVLAIVVEANLGTIIFPGNDGGSGWPLLAVSATTERLP